ncbi:translesion error-prone DNA polymerase V subunit UmuC [Chrysiogenes arsenatis]|uniref:translesion error-prone DNA polymerase V subunit UmuC n=1 Tax=Chrysiogenes arsenatis TaxID=309797 RepID=UPI000402F8B8|nr:translesion error-prone DNA polymerase V subunit UmuC [Chrysiogenes arsenatis]
MISPMPLYALIDGNNFYASCEKIFRPDLKETPVVVFSNNDGCVVARSKEAKALGIKMGVPAFQIKNEIERHGIVAFSSNYPLYADMSARMMAILETLAPRMEIYSIDEAFLDVSGIGNVEPLAEYGQRVRQTVSKWIGITVGIGIGPTKTLAKLANYAAKKYPATNGVVDLTDSIRQRKLMEITPVSDVWGVGKKTTEKLHLYGIKTALQLAQANPQEIKRRFSVTLSRTIHELNGIPCFAFEESPPIQKQLICSRSFGKRITANVDMQEAVCTYAGNATAKLREQKLLTQHVTIFLQTSPFSESQPYYANSASMALGMATDDSRDIISAASSLLQSIWREGHAYSKAGVMLGEILPRHRKVRSLFEDEGEIQKSQQLMQALDRINRGGRGTIWFAAQGKPKEHTWDTRQVNLSPRYTTKWDELPVVR